MRFISIAILVSLIVQPTSSRAIPEILSVIRADTVHSNFGCYIILPAGDQNGDGLADFWTWDERRIAFLFQGDRDSISSQSIVRLHQVNPRSSNVGDVTGDGYDDYCFTGFENNISRLNLYFGGPLMDSSVDLHFGMNTGVPFGTYQAYGNPVRADFDADGSDELITGSPDGVHALLYRLQSPIDSIHDLIIRPSGVACSNFNFGRSVVSGDFSGDGYPDLVLNLMPHEMCSKKGELWVYFGGPSFDTIPEMRFNAPGTYLPVIGMERFGTVLVNLGDINGDGYDDLFSGYFNSNNLPSHIYFGGPGFDSLPDVTISETAETAASAGDVNRDGYPDLIIGYPLESSSAAYALVYHGGPIMDSIADITIFAGDLPEYNLKLGSAVAGVGDVNGDGVDDFAIGAVNAFDRGEVFVFSGTGIPVDVEYDATDRPYSTVLEQNYPNPFNSTTRIRFSIPERSEVRLIVLDVLGRIVTVLASGEMVAGEHSVDWDGLNSSGVSVASGVYFYQLSVGNFSEERKMILLK